MILKTRNINEKNQFLKKKIEGIEQVNKTLNIVLEEKEKEKETMKVKNQEKEKQILKKMNDETETMKKHLEEKT